MRILFVTWNVASHYYHLVPLAWALRASGHEVCVASEPSFAEAITQSGMIAVPVGSGVPVEELIARSRQRAAGRNEEDAVSGQGWSDDWKAAAARAFGMFTEWADTVLDDLIEFARSWRPDLVVYEPACFAGPLVAEAIGVPSARHLLGVDTTGMAAPIMPDLLAPLAERLGVQTSAGLGTVTIDNCPPSMQIPADVKRLVTRYIPYNGSGIIPDWSRDRDALPRFLVTWGFSASSRGRSFLLPSILEALRDLPVEVMVTVSADDRDRLATVPDNVRVVEALPLHLILPTCDALIHQGGMGGILTALRHGVPQIIFPEMADEMIEARQLEPTGAAIVVPRQDADAAKLGELARSLLEDAAYREAAGRIRDEMLAQTPPAQLVPALERLASPS
ncbi:nucleotide disphospho-sugar-binding domain-containing protein [Nonomuraea sp. NPDC059007]|uniref:nucleotide disphospho-sugar-binding domain-containing protein n=1 Tax=Nonomuraea sp. NPDC059007 TaxID=3346692 RepID=UPI00369AE743